MATASGRAAVRAAVQGGLWAAAGLGTALSGLLWVRGPALMGVMGVDAAVVPLAMAYVKIRSSVMALQLCGMACNAALLGLQDSRTSFAVTVAAAAANLLGDWYLCGVRGAGLRGAALATAASLVLYCGLQMLVLHFKGVLPPLATAFRLPTKKVATGMALYCGPYSFAMFTRVAGVMLVTSFAARVGALPLAAHQILMAVFYFLAAFGEPLGQAAQAMVPRILGGRDRRREAFRFATVLGTICCWAALLLGTVAAGVLKWGPGLFAASLEVQAALQELAPMMFGVLFFSSVNVVIDGLLLGLKDLKGIMSLVCLSSTAQLACLFLFGLPGKFGLAGVWVAMLARLAAWFLAGIPRILVVFRGMDEGGEGGEEGGAALKTA